MSADGPQATPRSESEQCGALDGALDEKVEGSSLIPALLNPSGGLMEIKMLSLPT